MQEIKEYNTPDEWRVSGVYISKEEWIEFLQNNEIIRPCQREWILRFYKERNHQSSCYLLGRKYNATPNSIESALSDCGRAILKHLVRFSCTAFSGGEEDDCFVIVIMNVKPGGKSGCQYRLRDELSAAIHDYLILTLLRKFSERVLPFGLSREHGIDELYKWELVTNCVGKDVVSILSQLIGTNLIDNRFDGAALKKLLNSDADEVARCFSILNGASGDLQVRYNCFRGELDALTANRWRYKISDERMASSFLACADPGRYTFYKNDAYNALCSYLRVEPCPPRKKMCHFFSLLEDIKSYMEADYALMQFFDEEAAGFVKSPLLSVQTIVWFMQDFMNQSIVGAPKYTWVPFVRELAEKLLPFRDHREDLIELFYGIGGEFTSAYQEEGENITDITPFTVLGTIAVGGDDRRGRFASYYKECLNMKADIPSDYTGFPRLHPQRVMFISGKDKSKYAECFWELFERALAGNDISDAFNDVMAVKGVNRNISMGLFWISPKEYLSLDSTNEAYLLHYGFPKIPSKDKITYDFYKKLMDGVRGKMKSGEIGERDFLEFSATAYSFGKDNVNMTHNYYDEITGALRDKKNIILQGAPGTGKTYAIPEIVTRLCEEKIDFEDRNQVMNSFRRLVSEKRVVFTTFHQSMDYEDFVEGLKPFVDENKNVYYDVADGIFKTLCKDAARPLIQNNSIDLNQAAAIWKVSLGGTHENDVRSECLENGHIRIGWDEYGENYEEQIDYKRGGRIVLDTFYNKMSEGDIVLSCYTNKLIDAIGVVEGDPEWHDEYKSLKRLRNVRWLVKGIKEDIYRVTGKVMTLSTVYRMNDISIENVLEILKFHSAAGTTSVVKNTKPYVIVIDEINRGNVSKIFGELITLLEADKRTDGEMPLSVRLPYSKTDLGIPSNLYLIGTMNTADRSLSQFDYAIRRRFRFIKMSYGMVEMKLSDGKVFHSELFAKVSKLFISNFDEYLENVNVSLLPADCFSLEFNPVDLWLGPSYFITNRNDSGSLHNNILYEIIPTLVHYVEDGVFLDETPVNALIEELKQMVGNV